MGGLGRTEGEKGTVAGTVARGLDGDSAGDFELGAGEDEDGVGAQVGSNKELAGRVEEDLVRVCTQAG